MNIKLFVKVILIALFVVLASVFGYFILSNKRYTNYDYGFRFNYPKDLNIHVKSFEDVLPGKSCIIQGYFDEKNLDIFNLPSKPYLSFCLFGEKNFGTDLGTIADGYPKVPYRFSNKDLFFKPLILESGLKAVEINKTDYAVFGYTIYIELPSGRVIEVTSNKPYNNINPALIVRDSFAAIK